MSAYGRTDYAGLIDEKYVGQKVTIKGWVSKRRDLGNLIFIDVRDRMGVVQCIFSGEKNEQAHKIADTLRNEYVVSVEGEVVLRSEGTVNDKIRSGKVEVIVDTVEILSSAKTLPFVLDDASLSSEELRMKYRYLDLRRTELAEVIHLRSKITKATRDYLDSKNFTDVETPILTKSTPEGARDYLVPSRVHPGEFYALPQSPQLFKQLLMVAGFDRYYQIARCFRDEDLRADRQPDFTQIDMEMSFMSQDEIITMIEGLIAHVMKAVKGIDVKLPFERMDYNEAMERFGSDKPDTRFGMELKDVSDIVENIDFKVFTNAIEQGGAVKCIVAKGVADKYSRKDIDALGNYVANYGAKGLAWVKVTEEGFTGAIAKFFDEEVITKIKERTDAEVGDIILFAADSNKVCYASLGALRQKLARDLDLIDSNKFNYLWVVNWPLLEFDEESGKYSAAHHPFTMPKVEDIHLLETSPEKAYAQAYDIVLNGYELGGGSIRIYDKDIQTSMLKALGFSEESARSQFGFLLDAFEYGVPPHGGCALGLDRFVMLLAGRDNLRDTIAFPKTANASCLMTESPSKVDLEQLLELNISVIRK
ncbi:aspartate--tRNA ligase [Gemella sp. GH3]|uniref:aspartate--tRNA ligase n=1 Tax=unclassified Gemella TaxID=2624949 RepID=UPI0015D0A80D|nr:MULTISPECIES: aspartate--tRNA ligase [unclassified Gemella]MBF0713274.1 aspartate--tRNA ligase [Gemella sp. GH3.1]NYS50226.1 aspartate--tRNA ligase [Gemella sp. GH3]